MLTDHEPDELLYPIIIGHDDDQNRESIFIYQDPILSSGILKAVVENDLDNVKTLVEVGKSVNINDNNGNTPLHFAVIRERVKILEYLITRDEIVLNSRNFHDRTPIFFAAEQGNYRLVKTLIDAGAEVNIPVKFRATPLHAAVKFPKIAKLLISNGAEINALDEEHNTALYCAVDENCLETVCMLLYYNADVNIQNFYNDSPFMRAVTLKNVNIQSALINYVSDFDISTKTDSLLFLAIRYDSPFIKEIVEGGAVFHRKEFLECLNVFEIDRFKMIWHYVDRFLADSHDMVAFLSGSRFYNNFSKCVTVIMENESAMRDMCEKTNLADFIAVFQQDNLSDLYLKFSCIFLMYGYVLMYCDIEKVFHYFGYCELFRIMLYMDYSHPFNSSSINFGSTTARAILNVKNVTFVNYCSYTDFPNSNTSHIKIDLERFLELFHNQPLIDVYERDFVKESHGVLKHFPKVPLLLELARNKTREHIVQKFKVEKTSQYYRIINYLPIPKFYKEILSYKRKLYTIPSTTM